MESKRLLQGLLFLSIGWLVAVWWTPSLGQNTVEIKPTATIRNPEYRSDAARAIDAYERLMDRYLGLVEANLTNLSMDVREISRQLGAIEAGIDRLSDRLDVLEKRLHNPVSTGMPPSSQQVVLPQKSGSHDPNHPSP